MSTEHAPGSSPTTHPEVVRTTRGMCHTCLQEVPAAVVVRDGLALLEKTCPEHGITAEVLSRCPSYWKAVDDFYFAVNSEVYPQRDYLVRMTETCNLDCPICLAKANTEDTPDLDLTGLEKLLSEKRRIKVDLMAAEPTIRKDLEDWVRKVKANGHICALHTNGIRLSNLEFARRMKEAGVDEVFLQFDGFDDEAHKVLRGRPLLDIRMKALQNLREVGLATSLIVVIAKGLNDRAVGEVFHFAMKPENDHIREVFYLGLRILGSARDAIKTKGSKLAEMSLMPDETLQMLTEQVPGVRRDDVQVFNKLYFALLSSFRVKKCLYVQHYLVARDGKGGFTGFGDLVDMKRLDRAANRYARQFPKNAALARGRFLSSLGVHTLTPGMVPLLSDMLRMQLLLRVGMNLGEVPRRLVILGFITACDPQNFDSQVALNCGKGELSVDGGFVDSGAVANVRREGRFDTTDRRPGKRRES